MLGVGSRCAVLPKERKLVRCDGVLLGCDRNPSLASLRDIRCDAVDDLDESSDTLRLCSPYVDGVEGFGTGAEGGRGRRFGGARNPSYSKKSSWAPVVGLSLLGFFSEVVAPFRLENMLPKLD